MVTDQFLNFSHGARPLSAGHALQEARIDELRAILGRCAPQCRARPVAERMPRAAAAARGDLAALRAETNSLLSAANTLGATALGEAALALALAAACDLSRALPLIEAIDEAARATRCAARQLLGSTLPDPANA